MIYDVVVVGAGPTGSTLAREIAEKGFRTLLCEEHKSVGIPCHCTGKLTSHAFQEFDLPRDAILNSVNAAVLHSPQGNKLFIRKKKIDSYILDRQLLDSRLSEMACSSGAELSLQTRVYDLHRNADKLIVLKAKRRNSSVEIKSRLVIDAEGALPILLQNFGLKRKSEYLIGLQYEMANVDVYSQDSVELYFSKDITPNFFAWVVPIGDRIARVGLCIRNLKSPLSINDYLEKFLKNYMVSSGRISQRSIRKIYSGVVPIGGAITRSYADSILVIGDAAGQVKSTSGGGIYFGLKAAKIAAETAVESLEMNDTSHRHLGLYEKKWKSCIGLELRITSIIRKILDSLTDDEIDAGFQILSEEDIIRIIEEFGDTAFQSEILKPLALKFLKESIKRLQGFTLLKKLFASGLMGLIS